MRLHTAEMRALAHHLRLAACSPPDTRRYTRSTRDAGVSACIGSISSHTTNIVVQITHFEVRLMRSILLLRSLLSSTTCVNFGSLRSTTRPPLLSIFDLSSAKLRVWDPR